MKQLLGLATLFAVARAYHESPPPWSPTYTVSGYLTIPFAEINEKFDAYYDEESGSSRIDYYDGMDKTYQLSKNGDFGKCCIFGLTNHIALLPSCATLIG